ncbi:GDP-mannose--glycolipid 4-beta-D-mannosyltransferase [Streptomyces sp. NP160]|uniref:GDP-mannose--glycolipid 4-beta-D-mannosyltransferase n=1 Tax=Streptomyces sp. NP160 TaxID=2586637 RepID=UPI0011195316|nr:GDP-mannose--glycolipid 4-beta-D-mannosyltransferase [Streptomyces sp. NP160]TNM61081.1 GDP-mannose--glycolipid 4-beta-D-mannosyltransferase [Streptomyces sp. NP160]
MLHSLSAPNGTTRFVDQVTQMAPAEVQVQYFSWRRALLGGYDVLHLHWPELLLRASSRRRRALRRSAALALLVRTRVLRTPVVRTVHNTTPHEPGSRAEALVLAAVDRATDHFVLLNPTTRVPRDAGRTRSTVILHGHYRDRFAEHPRSQAVSGRVVYAGIIRPYKGVDRLIEITGELGRRGAAVRVVGSPSGGMRELVESAVDREPALSARLEFVPDADLVAEVTAGELVVLPYRELHNSGALLVALSLDRPVLVPRTPSTEALRDEAGEEWVHLYDDELTADDVVSALQRVRAGSGGSPHLAGRDWDVLGRQHADLYDRLLGGRGARGRS